MLLALAVSIRLNKFAFVKKKQALGLEDVGSGTTYHYCDLRLNSFASLNQVVNICIERQVEL